MRKLLLLRPEPGLSASAERARAMGMEVIAVPLFKMEPVAWLPPDPDEYDALLLTSANAVRFGGAGLDRLKQLPVHAVGDATAAATLENGFSLAGSGDGGIAELLASLPDRPRLLHLAGEDRARLSTDHHIDVRIVYRSVALADPDLPALDNLVVAIHSPRAGARLAGLARSRASASIAAISAEAARACGGGWSSIDVADQPHDASILALAVRLCQISSPK